MELGKRKEDPKGALHSPVVSSATRDPWSRDHLFIQRIPLDLCKLGPQASQSPKQWLSVQVQREMETWRRVCGLGTAEAPQGAES